MSETVKKHEVRSFGIISLFFLFLAGAMIWFPAWNAKSTSYHEHTLHRAESLAYQLLEGQQMGSRGPASVQESTFNRLNSQEGSISLDPWGHPYNFKLLKSLDGQRTKVLVWSLGPNGQSETTLTLLESNRDKDSPDFEGDDLGIMISIK